MEYIIVKDGIIIEHLCGGEKPEEAIEVPTGFPGYIGMKFAALKDDLSGVKTISQQVAEGILTLPEGFKANKDDTELIPMDQEEIDKIFIPEIWAIPGTFEEIIVKKTFDNEGNFNYFPPENAIKMQSGQPSSFYYALDDGTWKFDSSKEEEKILEDNISKANSLISAKVQNVILQASTFSTAEFSLLAKAKMYEEWQVGRTYDQSFRLAYNGVVYEVVQKVTAIEGQYPGSDGMLAIYRPLSIDSSTGEEPDGSKEKPFVFIYGMDVKKDMYYTYEDKLYLSKADMPACVWYPGTAGLWQWELVE